MKKNKINKGHYLELLDRIHVQSCIIEDHLLHHPLTNKSRKVKKLIDSSHWSLLEAYQIIGQKTLEYDDINQKNISRRYKKSKV